MVREIKIEAEFFAKLVESLEPNERAISSAGGLVLQTPFGDTLIFYA